MDIIIVLAYIFLLVLFTFWIALSICVLLDNLRKKSVTEDNSKEIEDMIVPTPWPSWGKIKKEKLYLKMVFISILYTMILILIFPLFVIGKKTKKEST